MSNYQRKSDIKLPLLPDLIDAYLRSGSIALALDALGVPESDRYLVETMIRQNPDYRSELERVDSHLRRPQMTPEALKADVLTMMLADVRKAYSGGVALSPDELPWDVQLLIKSAKQDRNGNWQYTFVDRGALADRAARLIGAYEQPDGGTGEIHIHLDSKDAAL